LHRSSSIILQPPDLTENWQNRLLNSANKGDVLQQSASEGKYWKYFATDAKKPRYSEAFLQDEWS
jgi:hypothetical protein